MDLAIIEHEPRGCTVVVTVSGELDIANVSELREHLIVTLERRIPSLLILDLSELEFIDSSGTAVLVNTQRRARLLGCTLALVAPRPAVSRVLQICGLDRYFLIFENFSAAVGKARAGLPGSPPAGDQDAVPG